MFPGPWWYRFSPSSEVSQTCPSLRWYIQTDLVSPLAKETNIVMPPLSKITLAYTFKKKDMDIEYISFLTALSPLSGMLA